MRKGYFITGTDTGVGKTYVTVSLLNMLRQQGFKTAALKPIATGDSEDANQLQQAASIALPYSTINPIAFVPAIAPHIAAAHANQALSVKNILQLCQPALASNVDYLLVEGIGGWKVPLNTQETLADFAIALGFPVILVVGMRLGCLNHAILTWENMLSANTNIAGWIANCIEPDMPYLQDNIETLKQYIKNPLLGIVPHQKASVETFKNIFLNLKNDVMPAKAT